MRRRLLRTLLRSLSATRGFGLIAGGSLRRGVGTAALRSSDRRIVAGHCCRARCRRRTTRRRRRRHSLLVLPRLVLLTLLDARLTLGGTALALCLVEQRTLMIERLQVGTALVANLIQTSGDRKALGTRELAGARARLDLSTLALDARALRRGIVGR
jgi:hypothetical protein